MSERDREREREREREIESEKNVRTCKRYNKQKKANK